MKQLGYLLIPILLSGCGGLINDPRPIKINKEPHTSASDLEYLQKYKKNNQLVDKPQKKSSVNLLGSSEKETRWATLSFDEKFDGPDHYSTKENLYKDIDNYVKTARKK